MTEDRGVFRSSMCEDAVQRGDRVFAPLRIEGETILRESPFDPVVDLPVRRILSIVYTESNQTQTDEIIGTVPSDWVWPFRHQRYDGLIARLQPG